MRRFVTFGPGLILVVAAAIALAAAPAAVRRVQLANIAAKVTLAQVTIDSLAGSDQHNSRARAIAESSLPGVAHIEVTVPRIRSFDRGQRSERPRSFRTQSSGAGWVYNDAGYIVTNSHVIADADEITVELFDGRVREGRVVAIDPETDIALLKVDAGAGVFPLRRASGQSLQLGDRVYAFGSPFGIKFSMSEGIVSGLGRGEQAGMVGIRTGYTNFIQTDAAMNPGNSGGPLIDVDGRVVGMNTAIANAAAQDSGPSGQSAGIGFAIPIETIEAVVDQLLDWKIVLRGYLGVGLAELRPDVAQAMGFDGAGVMITSVPEDRPAARAGLQTEDIVIEVDDRPTPNMSILRSVISVQKPGAEVSITYWRNGAVQSTLAKLGAAYVDSTNDDLIYVEGSEDLTMSEIQQRIRGQVSN